MNTRITDFGNGYVEEIFAPSVALHWDPITNLGSARFQMECFATMNNVLRTRTPAGVLDHYIDPFAPKVFNIPQVTENGLPVLDGQGQPVMFTLSSVQISVIMKACFDQLHNEKFAPPAPEPE